MLAGILVESDPSCSSFSLYDNLRLSLSWDILPLWINPRPSHWSFKALASLLLYAMVVQEEWVVVGMSGRCEISMNLRKVLKVIVVVVRRKE